jgi:hypothetical protein
MPFKNAAIQVLPAGRDLEFKASALSITRASVFLYIR